MKRWEVLELLKRMDEQKQGAVAVIMDDPVALKILGAWNSIQHNFDADSEVADGIAEKPRAIWFHSWAGRFKPTKRQLIKLLGGTDMDANEEIIMAFNRLAKLGMVYPDGSLNKFAAGILKAAISKYLAPAMRQQKAAEKAKKEREEI